MTEMGPGRLWSKRIIFALLVCGILFFNLLPLDMAPTAWVGPDLLLAFAFAWSTRRPEFVPILALASLFLLADLLLQRPPGLWALCALLACERLKTRARSVSELSFAGEWMSAAVAATVVIIGYRLVLAVTLVPLPPLSLMVIELMMTILFYPVAVVITQWGLGVKRLGPGDFDRSGGKL
ncbi:MAG: rod shape-determining protein MreD [Pseudomonadota bacterium]